MKKQPPAQPGKLSGKSLMVGLLLASLCLGTGCDIKMPWDKPKPKAEAAATEETGADGEGESNTEPVKVNELDFLPPDMKKLPFEEVNIKLNDGLLIYGRLYDPGQKLASSEEGEASADAGSDKAAEAGADGEGGDGEYKGPKYPLIILLHGIDRDHTTWSDLPVSLVKAGFSVFAMDLRGHGKSTTTVHHQRVTWRFFEPEQWQLLPKDVDQVIQHFQKDEEHPQIDGKNVGLVGEKLGANVAVFTGRDMSPSVKAIVLISPGLDYKGLIPSQAIIDYLNPALLITTQDDPYSYQSTERLYNWLLGVKALQVYKKIGNGSDMLSHQSALGDNITEWLMRQIPSPGRAKPVDKIPEATKALETEEDAKATEKSATDAKKPPAEKPKTEAAKSPNSGTRQAKPANKIEPPEKRNLPSDRLGQADEAPSIRQPAKKASIKPKSVKPIKALKKPTPKSAPVSKSAPIPPAASSAPTPGQAPVPGG